MVARCARIDRHRLPQEGDAAAWIAALEAENYALWSELEALKFKISAELRLIVTRDEGGPFPCPMNNSEWRLRSSISSHSHSAIFAISFGNNRNVAYLGDSLLLSCPPVLRSFPGTAGWTYEMC